MKYRPIMILGTGSDVGKSIITAALCRIFHQEGIRVAPFKAQNMALNSFITPEGGEIGRAQVVQAQAAGIDPHVDMNPILLKPTGEAGSQVIVHGRVYGNFTARDYYKERPKFVRKVMASFRRLSRAYELIVLEGAGSAAELNLKKGDLVNFSMARRAGASVVLVADIDRGGVFAATIGTYHLLTRSERKLLGGFIINKFRGDRSLFDNGVEIIQKRTKRPVLGVVPYARDLAMPEEDSVALDRHGESRWSGSQALRIGVIRLPHISNYTDFDPFEHEQGVSLRYLDWRDTVEDADLLILPGSKNTISDLRYLIETGLFERIIKYAKSGGRIIGICGGYQLLGRKVRDQTGVEGAPTEEAALGLLPVVTTMLREKTTTQVTARAVNVPGIGKEVRAYEIHMGITEAKGPGGPAFEITVENGRPVRLSDGWVGKEGRIWGTYLHGIFENDGFRHAFLNDMRKEGMTQSTGSANLSYSDFLQRQLDGLADLVRDHVDMEIIRNLIRK